MATTPTERPDPPTGTVQALHAELDEAHADGASSNDWTQIIDDWFVNHGFPSILYQDPGKR